MLKYKDGVLDFLKSRGYSTYKLRKDKIMGESKIQNIRKNLTSIETIDQLCYLLGCQPGDILEYVPDEAEIICNTASVPLPVQMAADTGDEHDRAPQTSLKKQKEAFEHYKD